MCCEKGSRCPEVKVVVQMRPQAMDDSVVKALAKALKRNPISARKLAHR